MGNIPVSVCMIAKNEERYIETCLKHLLPYGMEIVVVDTGSTDRTKEIAKKYTDQVYDFVWINDFAAARNYAAAKAHNNWILVLDCDEYIQSLDEKALRICMQQHIRHVGMLELHNMKTLENGEKTYHADKVPRFYNRNFFEYRFRIHEQITPKNQLNLSEVRLLTYPLPALAEHYGYDIPPEEMRVKQYRNLELLKSSIGETPFDDYLYFQMGQSYYVLQDYETAIRCYQKCLELNDNFEKGFMKLAVMSYARALEQLARFEEEKKLLLAYEDKMQTAEFFYTLGSTYQNLGDNLEALLMLVKVTQMPDFDTLGESAYDTYVRIMQIHGFMGNQEGVSHFKKRLEEYGLSHGRKIVFQ